MSLIIMESNIPRYKNLHDLYNSINLFDFGLLILIKYHIITARDKNATKSS